MEVVSLIVVAVTVVLFSVWYWGKGSRNYLPGPMGLPIAGYLPYLTSKPYEKLTELAKTYGPVYSLPLGFQKIVVITDFKSMKKAFASDAFTGRAPDTPFELSEETIKTGAILGPEFKEQRRFTLNVFRDLGFGKTRIEEHIKEEILEVIALMSVYCGKTARMSDLLDASVSNNIASVLFGKRLRHDDPRRRRLNGLHTDVGRLAGSLNWQLFFPWIRAAMKRFGIGNLGLLIKAIEDTKDFIREEIKEHEATLDPNNVRDFLDGFLIEIHKNADVPDTIFTREVLADLARAFFTAGSEAVRIAVDWLLLLCTAFPDVQRKIHREIDQTLGRERFPTGQDRPSMPYTEAAICEMIRWKSVVPFNVMHYTLADTELNGYFIPKHTSVLAVLWAVDHNKELWGEDVFVYRPERFLSPDGKKCVKPEYFIPFSIGKRQCPGKSFAEIEVFLYVASILQNFEFSLPEGKTADFEGPLGIGIMPKRQDLCIKAR